MPYDDISELPKGVRNTLPEEAQEIFRGAFNSAWEEYSDPEKRKDGASQEEVAMRVAWSAVKKKYRKDEDGNWVRK